jgi:thiamin-phosphate kinase
MRLPTGKVGPRELERFVFPLLRLRDPRVLLGPGVGLDAAVVSYGPRALVLSCDPITGALENLGWLAVNINANDIATLGATPRWFLCTLFLPEKYSGSQLRKLMEEIQGACDELEVSLVGGHTEITPGISRVVISGAMIGEVPKNRLITPAGAKPGDEIIVTKTAAIEGTAILACDRGRELSESLSRRLVIRAKRFLRKISVVREALIAAKLGASAMHDPTEGGILGGLHELADASEAGFKAESSKIPVAPETREICGYFNLDPLQLISSGSLLITASPSKAPSIVKALRKSDIPASEIGKIVRDPKTRQLSGKPVKMPKRDHLWLVFQK